MTIRGSILVLVLGLSGSSAAQQPSATLYPVPGATQAIGTVTCCPGDLDGDGVDDLVTGAVGEAAVFSMARRELLYTLRSGMAGVSASGVWPRMDIEYGPDLDGDGVREIALLSKDLLFSYGPDSDRVFVYSGRTGDLLFRIRGGSVSGAPEAFAFVPDLNGDGRADIAVASAYGGYPTSGYEHGGVTIHLRPRRRAPRGTHRPWALRLLGTGLVACWRPGRRRLAGVRGRTRHGIVGSARRKHRLWCNGDQARDKLTDGHTRALRRAIGVDRRSRRRRNR